MLITKRYILISTLFCVSALFLLAFQTVSTPNDTRPFIEALEDFPREETNLRKWDAPVIADLDRDGYADLILNDHGFGIRICWNNKGKFSKPYDLIMGDIHGVSVGDFDMDSNLEIILSRGGGSGTNARNSKIFRVDKQRNFTELPDFNEPLALMRGRTVKWVDLDNDGDLDLLNFAFPDKNKKGNSENYIYENDGKGQLLLHSTLPSSKGDGQKTLVTDFNGDGIFDLLLYGHENVVAYQGKKNFTYENVTNKIFPLNINKVTGIAELDYDNDGDFDLFITRGQEFEAGETFYDGVAKTMGFFTKRGKFNFDEIKVGDVLNLENYHTQWPQTNQLYIGETGYDYEHAGETHSGKDIRLVNSDAMGFPDKLSKKGIYIGYVGNQNWRIGGEIWGPLSGVVHGVSTYPKTNHLKGLNDILLQNNNGKFKDVSQEMNLQYEEHTTGAVIADFDNNGWQDILVIRRGDLIHENESLVFLNRGKEGFERLQHHHIISSELGAIGLGAETIDYNKDGKMDVILGNERGKWHLFKNNLTPQTGEANYINIGVGNSPSGKATALGALITLESCNTKQVKIIGSTGANYSLSFNNLVHFGLGACKQSVKVSVKWTNGEEEKQTTTSTSTSKTVSFGK